MKRNQIRPAFRGFTLMELLIVLAILIVIIGILSPIIWSALARANRRATQLQINNFMTALKTFNVDQGRFPTMIEGLYILVEQQNPDAQEAMQKQQQLMGNNGMNFNNMGGMNSGMMSGNMGGMNSGMMGS
ncbi:MAG: type II secretion system protein GspG, partial [Planctomycetia bacterium]|nr:type II secretion system protein GspG [Planctomycetia bacterium]